MARRILVVDESGAERDALVATIERSGFSTLEANRASESLAIAEAKNPVAIVITKRVADSTGLQICRRFASIPSLSNTPVLMIMEDGTSEEERLALDAGARAALYWPVDLARLNRELQNAIISPDLPNSDDTRSLDGGENPDSLELRLVESLMTEKVATIAPDASVLDAALMLRKHGFSCVVVCRDNRPLGIVSERDIVRLFG